MTEEPRTIGKYRVSGVIGSGGFATVFRCFDDRLDTEVAIKVLADNHAFDPDLRARFLSEGRILRRLDSRDLVQIYDVGTTDSGQPYLVEELADKGDLRSRIQDKVGSGWTPEPSDIEFVLELLAGATTALHSQELIHRDISPGNLLIRTTSGDVPKRSNLVTIVDSNERLILADLGLVKDLAQNSGISIAGGTPDFGAPEQLAGHPVTPKADVYACARVAEWLLSFVSDNSDWKPRLLAALAPALSGNPNDRPATVTALAAEIKNLHQAVSFPKSPPISSSPPTRHQPAPTTVDSTLSDAEDKNSRRVSVWVGIAAISTLLALGSLTAAFLSRSSANNVTSIGDNVGRATRTVGDVTLVVDGPERIPVGRTGRFVASVPENFEVTWTAGDKTVGTGQTVLDFVGVSAGDVVLKAVASGPSGQKVELVYPFRVTEE